MVVLQYISSKTENPIEAMSREDRYGEATTNN